MFNALRQCRYVMPLAKMTSLGMRQFSTHNRSFIVPSCSTIMTTRTAKVKMWGWAERPVQLTFKDVEKRVLKAIKAWDRFPQDKLENLTMDSRFAEDLSLDSLDMVEVTMALEDEFGFEFAETNIDAFKTPQDIYKFVCKHEDVYE